MRFVRSLFFLVITAAVFYGLFLGQLPLDDYDEATYATVVREMVENGNVLKLTYFGEQWIDKPPLQFWLIALSAKIFGLNEFVLRLPTILFGILAAAFVYLITFEITRNRKLSFFAGLALILFPLFIAPARHVRLDVPVTTAILSALYFFIRGQRQEKFLLGIGVSIGIGVMLKSVIGFFSLPLIAIFSFLVFGWGWVRNRYFWLGAAGGLLIALPWHIYQAAIFEKLFWQKYLGFHVAQRLTENVFGNQLANFDYLFIWWKYGQPWSAFFVATLILAMLILLNKRWRNHLGERAWPFIAAVFSALFIFAVFLFAPSKLMTYFIPAYPLVILSLALAYWAAENFLKFYARRLKILIAVAFLFAVFVSAKEAFFKPELLALEFSKDEKAIGLYLAENHSNEKILSLGWDHHQTLRYYSRREIQPLPKTGEIAIEWPFWLIIPNTLIEKYDFVKPLPQPYVGSYLTLAHFSK